MIKVVTHNGNFHTDEIVAIALHKVYANSNIKILRTRDSKTIKEADIAIDVGGEYNGDNLLDHHQFTKDSELYGLSSAGLVVKTLKHQTTCNDCGHHHKNNVVDSCCYMCGSNALISNKYFTNEHKTFIKAVDARDTFVNYDKDGKYTPLFNNVNSCNLLDINSKEQDDRFSELVELFVLYFSNTITYSELFTKIEKIAKKEKAVTDNIYSARKKTLKCIVEENDLKVYAVKNLGYVPFYDLGVDAFLMFDDLQDCYSLQVNTEKYKIIDVENKIFIHSNGFIAKFKAGTVTLEDTSGEFIKINIKD